MSPPGGRNEKVRCTLCHIVVPGDDCCSGVCERAKGTGSFLVFYALFAVITWKYIGFGIILFIICFAFARLYQRFVLRCDTEGATTRMVGQ